jgi:carotenoid cleavage dioxygenase-like enzyme
MSQPFSNDPMNSGLFAPWPMEGEIRDIAVSGEIPADLHGTLYRNGPNPQFPPLGPYHFFGGDGMIHAFHLEGGKCSYRNRWVHTPKFEAEREAGESLFTGFGSKTPSDERAAGILGGPSNTNVVWHGDKLLALVEGGLVPVRLDPVTLETLGQWNFEGGLRLPIDPDLAAAMGIDSPDGKVDGTFTAHPKIDPQTGEMLAFGYSGIPPYVVYHVIDASGRLVRSVPIDTPFPSMVHDFITTPEHVIFPICPATLRIERMQQGEGLLGWEPDLGTHVGVMPRDGSAEDMVWFQTDPCYVFHPMNAHSDGRRIIAEMAQYPRVPVGGAGEDVEFVDAHLVRWTLDLDGGTLKQEPIDDRAVEFPRIDERFTGLDYRYGFAAGSGAEKSVLPLLGMNAVVRYDVRSGARDAHDLGAHDATGEPIFVPRNAEAAEGEGYVLSVVYRSREDRSDLLILDAENVSGEPVATVHLPHRVPGGFHGNWRPGAA